MARSPKNSDESRIPYAPLTANNRCYGNNVIGIGGMTHPEKKSQRNDGNKDHRFKIRTLVVLSCASECQESEMSSGLGRRPFRFTPVGTRFATLFEGAQRIHWAGGTWWV